MRQERFQRIVFAALLLFVGLLFGGLTLPLGRMAQLVPMRVLVPTIALLVIQLCIEWRDREHPRAAKGRVPQTIGPLRDQSFHRAPTGHRDNLSAAVRYDFKEYPTLLLLGFLPVLIFLFGFTVSATLFIWLYFRLYFKKPFLFSTFLSLGAAVFLYILLSLLLGMELRSGFLWQMVASAI